MRPVVNHVGMCVADLDRSRRFYESVLGFEHWRDLEPPDAMVATLIDIPEPVGVKVVYLRRDGLVLELMHFTEAGEVHPVRARVMNEVGLTHVSVSVDDVGETAARVVEHGGSLLDRAHPGAAVMVRDPDGQLVELLPMGYRASLPE